MPDNQLSYQATCLCGQSLNVPNTGIGQVILCPACNRSLLPINARQSADSAIQSVSMEFSNSPINPNAIQTALKICPFCSEKILATARKCRFCGEFMNPAVKLLTADAAPLIRDNLPAPEADTDKLLEQPPVFTLSISQWDNLWRYLTCFLALLPAAGSFLLPDVHQFAPLILAGVGLVDGFAVLWIYFSTRSSRCIISPTRIETQTGILGKHIEWVSLASVVDIRLRQTLLHRLLGIGTIIVNSSDQVTPILELYHLPHARKVFEYIQNQISILAQRRLNR